MSSRSAGQILNHGEGRWLIRWFLGRDASGRRRYGAKTVRGTRKDALAALRDVQRQLDLGVAVGSRTLTLDTYLDEWIEKAARNRLRPHTLTEYQRTLRLHVRPLLGRKRLDRLSPIDVQGMVNELGEKGSPVVSVEKRRPLAPRTVRLAHDILSGALRQAVRWRMVDRNACQGVELPRQLRTEMRAMNRAEARAFQKAIQGKRHEAFFLLLLGTGLRPSEALALRWADIELEQARLRVERTLPRRKRGEPVRFDAPKTAKSRRVVPLPGAVVAALRGLRQAAGVLALDGSDLAFQAESGRPLDEKNLVHRHFKVALVAAELPKAIRLYDLRHTFATLALEAGVHPKVVAERLGHSSIQITMDVYAHVTEPMQKEATGRIEAAIFSA